MKKTLLTLSACVAVSASAMAQYTETFESTTGSSLPIGWTQIVVPTSGPNDSVGFNSGTDATLATTGFTVPAHTRFVALNDDRKQFADNSGSFLMSPAISMTGLTTPYLSFDCSFLHGAYGGQYESANVKISTDGGTTWFVLDTLAGNTADWWETRHYSLSAYATAPSIMVGFYYTDHMGWEYGLAIDNVKVYSLPSNSVDVTGIAFDNIAEGISTNGSNVLFRVQNTGSAISDFDAKFSINGVSTTPQNFTASLAPYASQVFTFTPTISGAVSTGANTIIATVTNVNGVANTAVDNADTATFILASASATRQGLIEEFSSSTCAPCKAFNQNWDPLMVTLNANNGTSNLNVLKYQMNWPSPGTDRSYNPDGDTRKSYYGVTGIPEHFVNGQSSGLGWNDPFTSQMTTDFTNEANGSHTGSAFFDISVNYKVDTANKNLKVQATVTPRFNKSGSYHVHVAVADKYYENTTNTTGQLKYYHVVRKMLPSGTGSAVSSWTDGTAQNYNFTHVYTAADYTTGAANYPTQGSYKFWNNPLAGSEVVVFVQDDNSKAIMQSMIAFPVASLNVSTLSKVNNMTVFPNPVRGLATLRFNLEEAGAVQVRIVDFAGKTVSEVMQQDLNAGVQNIAVPTGNIAAGNYVIVVSTATGNNAVALTVE